MQEPNGDHRSVFPMRVNTALCKGAPDAGNRHYFAASSPQQEQK